MKVITTVAEIKSEAANDNRASFLVQLNKEIVDWLISISGKNRDIVRSNVIHWQNCIRNGEWCVDNAEMKINSTCDWQIEGHHRVLAVDNERAYGLIARMIVVPKENEERCFKNQDVRGARRSISAQATLLGMENATRWFAVDRAYRLLINADISASSIEGCERFIKEKKQLIDSLDLRIQFRNEDVVIRSCLLAAQIRAAETYPNRIDDLNAFWDRIITGEMLNSSMPEYHIRNRIRGMKDERISPKEIVWLFLKAVAYSIDGFECKNLKVIGKDEEILSKRFGVASVKNKKAYKKV